MSKEVELTKLLKEARTIIRASLSRGLYQDWDRRATKALAKPKVVKWEGDVDVPGDYAVTLYPLEHTGGFAPFRHGIKITHTPTGLTASCGTERSDHSNHYKAWEELQTKLMEYLL